MNVFITEIKKIIFTIEDIIKEIDEYIYIILFQIYLILDVSIQLFLFIVSFLYDAG